MHLHGVGDWFTLVVLLSGFAVLAAAAERIPHEMWRYHMLRLLTRFAIWTLIVIPVTINALWYLKDPVYSSTAQMRDFLLSLPIQIWAVRRLYYLLRCGARVAWDGLRWVVLRGLGVTEADLRSDLPTVPASFLRGEEEQEPMPKEGFQFSGQYADPERWTI